MRREFEQAILPYLVSHRPWGRKPCPPEEKWDDLRLSELVTFDVKFPPQAIRNLTIPSELLPEVFEIVRRATDRGVGLLADIGTQYWRTATFHFERGAGSRYLDDPSIFLHWVAALFDRLSNEHPETARREVDFWRVNDQFFFDKLKLYVWMKPHLFSGTQVATGLLGLTNEGFWNRRHRRELLHTMRSRWSDFSQIERDGIEARIIAGPSRLDDEEEADYARRKSITSAMILGWLEHQRCAISILTGQLIPELRRADPRWQPSWDATADRSNEARSGYVRTEVEPSKIINARLSELIPAAREHTKQKFGEFTRYEPFQGVVQSHPSRALAALAYEARRGEYPLEFWSTILSYWPENTSERLKWLFARRIVRLPTTVVCGLAHETSSWFGKNLPMLAKTSFPDAIVLWDAIVDHLFSPDCIGIQSSLGDVTIAGEPQNLSRRTYEHAINSPTGAMTDALFKMLEEEVKVDVKSAAFLRLERLLRAPDEAADHAVSKMTFLVTWLDYLDSEWVNQHIIPMFELGHDRAEPAWNGFLHSDQLPAPELFDRLKNSFIVLFKYISQWRWDTNPAQRLAEFLVIACYWNQRDARYVTYSEARVALQNMGADDLAHAAWFLGNLVKEQNVWRSFGKPFIQLAWPQEARHRTERASHMLALMALDAGTRFPDVVAAILLLLVPIRHVGLLANSVGKDDLEGGTSLATKFPEPMLMLLDRLVPDDPAFAPYDLASALGAIAEAAPRLRQDARWRRLDDLLKQR
jgi:hypothetical protein